MQIQKVLSGYADSAMQRRGALTDALDGHNKGNKTVPEKGNRISSTEAARNILQEYDVTRITPSELTKMIQELFEAGAINQQEFEQLSAIRLDLDLANIDPDESIDLLQFYRDKLQNSHGRAAETVTAPSSLANRLDWIEKFALVQSNPGVLGVDTLA